MTTRRSFIGQTIGIILGSNIEFVAEEYPKEPIKPDLIQLYKARIRVFEIPEKQIYKFKSRLILKDDEIIKGPNVMSFTISIGETNADIDMKFHIVRVNRPLTFKTWELIDDQNVIIQTSLVDVTLLRGDNLELSSKIGLTKPPYTY